MFFMVFSDFGIQFALPTVGGAEIAKLDTCPGTSKWS